MEWIYILLVLAAGFGVPVQTAANTALGKSLGGPVHATLMVFFVGLLLVSLVFFLQKQPIPTLQAFGDAPWWSWMGGPLGVAYIFVLILVAPRIGMASAVGFVIAGQILGSVMLDHFGWFNFPVHAINWKRLLGAVLLITGVYLIRRF